MTETLEWEKWSMFNQNRCLEEAKRFSKPGLVAQKKALFEAHFKKIAADRAAALLEESISSTVIGVPKHDLRNENLCEPCVDLESGKSKSRYLADAAQNSAEADSPFILRHSPAVPLLESQSGEAYCDEKNDSTAEVSDFGSVNNSDPTDFVQMDEPCCDLAIDTSQNIELCDKMDAHYDSSKCDYMEVVVEPSSFIKFDPPDVVKTELDELDRSEVVNNSSMLLDDPQKKIAVQEPADQLVLASLGKYKPTLTCPKTLAFDIKPPVQFNSNLRPPALPKKENDITRSTRACSSALLNKKRSTTMSLHTSINLNSSHQDSKRPLTPTKLDSTKKIANLVSLRNFKERPDQVAIDTKSKEKLAAASNTQTAIRKSSAAFYTIPAPPLRKKDRTVIQRDSASMRNTVDMRKSKPKSLHMSINLDSRVGAKERQVSLQSTGTVLNGTVVRMSMSYSAHAPANQVISDTTTRRKQIIPVSNSSTDDREPITQFHAKPPPYKNKNSGIQSNSALTLSQNDIKKYLPQSLHKSVDLSSTVRAVRKTMLTQKIGSSSINAPTVRASRDCSNQGSLRKSMQNSSILLFDDNGKQTKTRLENTTNGMKDTEKCPPHKMDRPETPTNLIRPPSPTVSTPFRFRSDERAAKRKEKLEEKYRVESENSMQRKGKFPSSRPQSPMYVRKPSPGKARETKNYKPPQAPAAGKAGSHQVTENKSSTTSVTLLSRKTACENASPNIKI